MADPTAAGTAEYCFLSSLGVQRPAAHFLPPAQRSSESQGPTAAHKPLKKITGGINREDTTLLFQSIPLIGNTHAQQLKNQRPRVLHPGCLCRQVTGHRNNVHWS